MRPIEIRNYFSSGTAKRDRQLSGVPLVLLADAAGVSTTTWWRWERGLKLPRLERCFRLVEVVEVIRTPLGKSLDMSGVAS